MRPYLSLVRQQRRGSYVVPFAIMLVVLLMCCALAVDVGILKLTGQELRQGTDAAAAAGASYLDGTLEGIDKARVTAVSAAAANQVRNAPLDLASSDIEFGVWDTEAGTFTVSTVVEDINAIRINKTL
jgi:Flp pilus assembly protein TadG